MQVWTFCRWMVCNFSSHFGFYNPGGQPNGSGPRPSLDLGHPRAGKGPARPGQRSKKVAGKKQSQGKRKGGANLQQAAPAPPESHPSPAPVALQKGFAWALEKELHQTRSCKRASWKNKVLQKGTPYHHCGKPWHCESATQNCTVAWSQGWTDRTKGWKKKQNTSERQTWKKRTKKGPTSYDLIWYHLR